MRQDRREYHTTAAIFKNVIGVPLIKLHRRMPDRAAQELRFREHLQLRNVGEIACGRTWFVTPFFILLRPPVLAR